ncbi:MAG: eight-cysteine-cluster domain-containing protein [archaeon]
MKKTYVFLFFVYLMFILLLMGCNNSATSKNTLSLTDNFCGSSTKESCTKNNDCIEAGCSSQICQGKSREITMTTCEYRFCYDAKRYNLTCGCNAGSCMWMEASIGR